MSRPIIEVRNVSKRYQLGAIGASSLREEFARYWDRVRGIPHPDAQDFWALRDISFDVQPGEVIGIIGRNGAGKSTLLKILSRITEPTSGRAVLRGRAAALLEVGTGFHPDLSGRDNIFLNGAILGMTRAEIRTKFDEIVAFAEVEKFIDTPVKRYSSGMYVRLAFSVAAHLEPDILIVDEVLAVGDVQFQKRCLGKMKDVTRRQGRTVVFVSHNMGAVTSLCSQCVFLERGQFVLAGPTAGVVSRFLDNATVSIEESIASLRLPGLPGNVEFTAIRSDFKKNLPFGADLGFLLTIRARRDVYDVTFGGSIFQIAGECVGTLFSHSSLTLRAGETRTFRLVLHTPRLTPGSYYAGFSIGTGSHNALRRDEDVVIGMPRFHISPVAASEESIANWQPQWGPIHFADPAMTEVTVIHPQ